MKIKKSSTERAINALVDTHPDLSKELEDDTLKLLKYISSLNERLAKQEGVLNTILSNLQTKSDSWSKDMSIRIEESLNGDKKQE